MTPSAGHASNPQRLFTFASGGWVLLLAGVLMAGVAAWRITAMVRGSGERTVGDGTHIETYGFDLSTCIVPRHLMVATGLPRDGLPVMVNPAVLSASEYERGAAVARPRGSERLVRVLLDDQPRTFPVMHGSDRVIGVEIGGEARAYPLWILAWHEVVNDTLGGSPICVTYSPLCDSAVVLDRRVGDELLEFGFSGLLYNSNLLMYDRHAAGWAGADASGQASPPAASASPTTRNHDRPHSLWSQLRFRAITGPAAQSGAALRVLPSAVMRWSDWRARFPQTSLLLPDPDRTRLYKRDAYSTYFGSDELHFPVEPLPSKAGLPYKTPFLAVLCNGTWHAFSVREMIDHAAPGGGWQTQLAGNELRFQTSADPPTAWLMPTDSPARPTVSAFWFAWHALYPDDAASP